jgi:lysozyme
MITPPMKTSANGRRFIEMKEESGVPKLKAYDDGTGTWTIGFGHTSAAGLPRVYPGMTITAAEADAILSSDLASVEIDVNHHINVQLNQNQFDALVSFDLNTGALDRSGLLQVINTRSGDITAAFEAWRYAHVHGVMVPILLGRRKDEATLYLTSEVSNGNPS